VGPGAGLDSLEKLLNEGITMCLKSISLYNMYVSTIFYSIVSFTYPIIRLHFSTVCQSSSALIQISYHMLFTHFGIP